MVLVSLPLRIKLPIFHICTLVKARCKQEKRRALMKTEIKNTKRNAEERVTLLSCLARQGLIVVYINKHFSSFDSLV